MSKVTTDFSPAGAMGCPVDFVAVNENQVRMTAFFVLLITAGYLLTGYPAFPAFLAADFLLRGFRLGKFSVLGMLAGKTAAVFRFPYKSTDQAPKRFAAKVGLIFSLLILAFYFLGWDTLVLSLILVVFATLESIAGFCAGCYVYAFLKSFSKPETSL